jgi:putative ABC transport system permease protein
MTLMVRTTGDPMALVAAVREKVRAVDSTQAVFGVASMTSIVERSVSLRRLETRFLTLFAALALFLAAIGI